MNSSQKMIKFFNRDKEQIKRVLAMAYKVKDIDKMSDDELENHISYLQDKAERFLRRIK